ncbi:MAG: hypothetical protein ACPLYD_06690, partial [Anaerolineae bacterium]
PIRINLTDHSAPAMITFPMLEKRWTGIRFALEHPSALIDRTLSLLYNDLRSPGIHLNTTTVQTTDSTDFADF